jgi:hypothetical protein
VIEEIGSTGLLRYHFMDKDARLYDPTNRRFRISGKVTTYHNGAKFRWMSYDLHEKPEHEDNVLPV